MTLRELVDEYLVFKREHNHRKTKGSLSTLECKLRTALEPLYDRPPRGVKASEMTTSIIDYGKKHAADTTRSVYNEIRLLWTWLEEENYLLESFFKTDKDLKRLRSKYPKTKKQRPQLYVDAARSLQAYLLPKCTEEPRSTYTVSLMALLMGFRVSEVLKLRSEQLDAGAAVIFVEDAKTEAGNRPVEVPAMLIPILREAKRDLGPLELVFPFARSTAWKHNKAYCQRAGVREVGPHALRRTNSTLRVIGHQDPNAVIRALGHTSFSGVTQARYVAPGTVETLEQRHALSVLNSNDLPSEHSLTD